MATVVTDDMLERGYAALARASFVDTDLSVSYLRSVAMEVVTAALNPPEDRACLRNGCPHERTGDSQFCSDPCRTQHWKDETGYVDPRYANRPNGTNGDEGGDSRPSPPRRPGGLQVAFGPAVNHVSKYLSDATPLRAREARQVAERVLTHALSTKQRARAKQRREAECREATR